jgi:PLD-like domain
MCTRPSSSISAVTGITADGSRMEWLKWIQWMRWPGPYEWHRLSVPERSQTYPDMEDSPDGGREVLHGRLQGVPIGDAHPATQRGGEHLRPAGTKNIDRSAHPLTITVHTEPLFTDGEHDVFFNRGVASSQAYERNFGSEPIDKMKPDKREKAIAWLTRDLDEALLRFIDNTKNGDRLLGCFYEFAYPPASDALVGAIKRGVDVHIVVDLKDNSDQFPIEENLAELNRSKFPKANKKARTARAANYAHNKFMVLIRDGKPIEVWTGSTNLTLGGVAGQTNVGHWLRNPTVADIYAQYWDPLNTDPVGYPTTRTPRNASRTRRSRPRWSSSPRHRPICATCQQARRRCSRLARTSRC